MKPNPELTAEENAAIEEHARCVMEQLMAELACARRHLEKIDPEGWASWLRDSEQYTAPEDRLKFEAMLKLAEASATYLRVLRVLGPELIDVGGEVH